MCKPHYPTPDSQYNMPVAQPSPRSRMILISQVRMGGYNCYLLIVDEFNRHIWIFIFANKTPPIDTLNTFFNTHGLKTDLCHIHIDQGGDISNSISFRNCIVDTWYTLETACDGTSFRNGIPKCPHQSLVDMIRTMIYGVNLPSNYWGYTIRHAVYIKNRLPHQSLAGYITPFKALITLITPPLPSHPYLSFW